MSVMETWTAIDTHRAVREFDGRPLEADHLRRILDAGRRSGSSKNLQHWDFVVCTDRAHLVRLAEIGPYARHLAEAAAGIALVTPALEAAQAPLSTMWDLGRAAQNMMLAAWDLGIGSSPATVYDHDLARELLGLPETHDCEFLLSFGYPADPAVLTAPKRAGKRKTLDEIVHAERW